MSIGRWFLRLKVMVIRAFMAWGMRVHRNARPKAPQSNFKIVIPSRLSSMGGHFDLLFYVPDGYFEATDGYKYPVVVNFHGGGFALGSATDDARWAAAVMKHVKAVFVSVEYRLAPEFPFSTAVEDGSDAIIFLASHAKELRLDAERIGVSGFSAGGNLTCTVPIMLYDLKHNIGKRHLTCSNYIETIQSNRTSTTTKRVLSSTKSVYKHSDFEMTDLEISQTFPQFTIKCLAPFYPPLDFRQSREERRMTNKKPEKNLPASLTNLFDQAYMYPRDKVDNSDPYLSPVAASNDVLSAAYPEHIVLLTCEYDMLNAEAVAFGDRLSNVIGKQVYAEVIGGVAHAFDKTPRLAPVLETIENCYAKACAELSKAFATSDTSDKSAYAGIVAVETTDNLNFDANKQ